MQYNRRGPQDAHFLSDGGVNLEGDEGLEAMLTHLPGVVYQLQHHGDGSWLFSYISSACREFLGLEAEAVRDRPHLLFERIVGEDAAEFWRSLQAAEQAQGPWQWQGRFCLPSGEIKWLETTANPQTLPGGRVVWAGLWLDITARKEAEFSTVAAIAAHSPEQRDEWLTILLDNAPIILYTLDTQGHFTFSAGSGLRLLGLQPQQVVGALVYDLYQDCQEALVAVDRALAGEASMATIQVGDVYFENSCIPCRDKGGAIVGVIGVALDISHRKQLEEAQRTQEYQIQRQNRALLDLSKNKVLSSGVLEKAFQEMTMVAATTLGIERASIWLFDGDRTKLQCQDLYQLSEGCHSQGIELGMQDYPGYFAALEHQATVVANEARTDPSTCEFTENYFRPLGITSLLDSPIQLGGQIVGVVCFEQVGEPRYWSQAEQTFSRSLADIAALAMEIHERQRAERDRDRFFAVSQDLLCVATLDGYFRRVNPAWETVLGYTEAELRSRPLLDFVHPSDRAATLAEARRLRDQDTAYLENRYRAKDGTYRWLAWNSTVSREDDLVYAVARDITHIKQAQKEHRKLIALIENSSDFICLTALDGRVLYLNPAGQRLAGVESLAAAKAYWLFEFLVPHQRDPFAQEVLPQVLRDGAVQGEVRVQPLGRQPEVVVEHNTFVIANPTTNEPLCLATILRDISDRKRFEADLLEREQFLRTIYDGIEQIISVLDVCPDGNFRVLGWNHVATRIMGLTSAQVQGLSLEEALGEEDGRRWRQRYAQALATGETLTYEDLYWLNGQESWWLSHITPLRNETGEVYRLVMTASDVSDRKRVEKEQARLIAILEATSDLVGIGDATGQSIYLNKAGRRMMGLPEESDITGIPCCDFVVPAQRERFQKEAMPFALEHGLWSGENVMGYRDAEVPVSQVIIIHRDPEGNVEFLSTVARDISDRKRTEAQLRQQAEEIAQTLRELQRTQTQLVQSEKMSSLGQLVAGVAHEINNPVNFISGNLSHASEYTRDLLELMALYNQHYPEPAAEIRERAEAMDLDFLLEDLPRLITSMRVGADRIRSIVTSLRTFSRMDEAAMKAVNIHEGIDSTLMILQNRLKAKSYMPAIAVIKDYGNLPLVECYAGQLNQVFMNILTNAIDALEERDEGRSPADCQKHPSQITIKTLPLEGDRVAIHLIDNGPGIPESVQQRLFDPFFTTKPVGKGTGLGMSISYQIVAEKHQGSLRCVSSPGQGAEFIITIPIHQRPDSRELQNPESRL